MDSVEKKVGADQVADERPAGRYTGSRLPVPEPDADNAAFAAYFAESFLGPGWAERGKQRTKGVA